MADPNAIPAVPRPTSHAPSVLAPVIDGTLPPSLQRLDKILVRACATELPGIAEALAAEALAAMRNAAAQNHPDPVSIASAAGKTDELIAALTAAHHFTSDPYWLHLRDIWLRAVHCQQEALAEATIYEESIPSPLEPGPASLEHNRATLHLHDAITAASRTRINASRPTIRR